jgi:hypothetical protein
LHIARLITTRDISIRAPGLLERYQERAREESSRNERAGVNGSQKRLHYLDWLQVQAIMGLFLFHAVHPFDDLADWHIKNAASSVLATFYIGFFHLWGMPFFFLMAGATSWFSLR